MQAHAREHKLRGSCGAFLAHEWNSQAFVCKNPVVSQKATLTYVSSACNAVQNSLTYATRVRTIKNEVTKMESNKEMMKLRRQLEYWKEQAGLSPDQRAYVDLEDIANERHMLEEE